MLGRFFLGIRKRKAQGAEKEEDKDEQEFQYEPTTLTSFQRSIHRHLRDNNYPLDIIHATEFQSSRDMLQAKIKELKKMGKGNKPQKAEAFTESDIMKMRQAGVLGSGNKKLIYI